MGVDLICSGRVRAGPSRVGGEGIGGDDDAYLDARASQCTDADRFFDGVCQEGLRASEELVSI
jgi:hypothetical protein